MGLGPTEILLILLAVAVLFGASRLPQLGKNLGEGIRNLKKGLSGEPDEERPARRRRRAADEDLEDEEPAPPRNRNHKEV
jgi:sec-independent protein translocase protein TatA